MDFFAHILFEQPLYICAAAGVAELLLLFLWRRERTRGLAAGLFLPAVAAVVVLGLAFFVETDRERIMAVSRKAAADIQAGRFEELLPVLADNFSGPSWAGPREAVEAAKDAVKRYSISSITIVRPDIKVTGPTARMTLRTNMTISEAGISAPVALDWEISWIHTENQWKIARVDDVRPAKGF